MDHKALVALLAGHAEMYFDDEEIHRGCSCGALPEIKFNWSNRQEWARARHAYQEHLAEVINIALAIEDVRRGNVTYLGDFSKYAEETRDGS